MASPAFTPPDGWIAAGVAAIVGALWAALRSTVARNEARLEAALSASEAERRRERDEAKASLTAIGAKLDAEREGRRRDNERSARALWQARSGAPVADAAAWEAEAPTAVRAALSVATPMTAIDRKLARADALPVDAWTDSGEGPDTQRAP